MECPAFGTYVMELPAAHPLGDTLSFAALKSLCWELRMVLLRPSSLDLTVGWSHMSCQRVASKLSSLPILPFVMGSAPTSRVYQSISVSCL
eukprot:2926524-Pyramimonas_sp.AAC.1